MKDASSILHLKNDELVEHDWIKGLGKQSILKGNLLRTRKKR